MATTQDPVSPNYVPAYEDPQREAERLERCLQQQIEDCFTTITRLQRITDDRLRWEMLRHGLHCWRLSIRASRRSIVPSRPL